MSPLFPLSLRSPNTQVSTHELTGKQDGRTTATRFEVVESEVRRLVPLVDDGIEEAQKWRQKACVMRERGVGCALDTDCLKELDVVARWMERLLDDEEEEFVRLSLNQVKLE